ncbi:MAG: N-acetylmuramoyl-L-alanine amidase [Clostridia bacterium]|nr:N-acetylmuramoyl-L-alanine amidase [Clostridia bacterium]
MFKLALNAGHGYNTAGKRCMKAIDKNETREYILNRRICDKIEKRLKEYEGISVLRIDDGTDESISKRAKKANDFKADFYLAIHHNAGVKGGSGGGIVVYVYNRLTGEENIKVTRSWQSDIYNAMIAETGLKGNRSKPINEADFGECRETYMPAVLCECGFMDSTVDTPIILTDEFAEKVAKACSDVIIKRAGLKAVKAQSESVDVSATPVKKTNEQLANEVIKGLWGNGAERKQKLTAAGYDYTAVQSIVNVKMGKPAASTPAKKTDEQMAKEVIKGLWGNGNERKQRLTNAGYNYSAIQKIVNNLLK